MLQNRIASRARSRTRVPCPESSAAPMPRCASFQSAATHHLFVPLSAFPNLRVAHHHTPPNSKRQKPSLLAPVNRVRVHDSTQKLRRSVRNSGIIVELVVVVLAVGAVVFLEMNSRRNSRSKERSDE